MPAPGPSAWRCNSWREGPQAERHPGGEHRRQGVEGLTAAQARRIQPEGDNRAPVKDVMVLPRKSPQRAYEWRMPIDSDICTAEEL